jgi:hypothetical protein
MPFIPKGLLPIADILATIFAEAAPTVPTATKDKNSLGETP